MASQGDTGRRAQLHNDGEDCALAGQVVVEQQVCNRSFSSGHGPAAGQISGEAEYG